MNAPALRSGATAGTYVALYAALDWVSLIEPFGTLGIAPWNPATGLSFALLLRFGLGFLPAVIAAVLLADLLLRDLADAPVAMILSALAIALGYGWAAWALRLRWRIDRALPSLRDLRLLFIVALAASTVVASAVVGVFAVAGLVAWPEALETSLHFWVGDVIGIAVLTPFLLFLFERERRLGAFSGLAAIEYVLQITAIGAGLWIIFGLESVNHFEFSYVLFLPLIWIGLRQGLTGAVWGLVITQLGLMLALQLKGLDANAVTQFQLLMLAVAVTGLFLGAVVDERRRAERALRDSEARLQTVVSTAPDAILTFGDSGAITSANPAAARLFGPQLRAESGITIQQLLPGPSLAEIKQAAGREMTARRLEGTSFVADVAAGEARSDGRSVYVAAIRDASPRKQAEAWLKEHEAELAHAARLTATGEMAGALAHELNQPLTALIGFARACQAVLESTDASQGAATARDLIDQAVHQALRMGDIIRSTREFLRQGDTQLVQDRLPRLFAAVVDLLRERAARHHIQMVVRADRSLPAVLVDPIQIEQVIVNLVRNSMDAIIEARSSVREVALEALEVPEEPGFVQVRVRDTGPGFASEMAERLFTPFATTRKSGMGLGLSISRSIIEAHGGRIWVEPADGGAEVRFTVPNYTDDR